MSRNQPSDGRHNARAVEMQFAESAEKKTPKIEVLCEIVAGRDEGMISKWEGWLTDKTIEKTLDALAIMGWPKGKKLADLKIADLCSMFQIVTETESWVDDRSGQERSKSKVQWINRPGQGGFVTKHAVEGAELRKMLAKWDPHVRNVEHYEPIPIPAPSERETGTMRSGEREQPPEGDDRMPQTHADDPGAAPGWGSNDDIPF